MGRRAGAEVAAALPGGVRLIAHPLPGNSVADADAGLTDAAFEGRGTEPEVADQDGRAGLGAGGLTRTSRKGCQRQRSYTGGYGEQDETREGTSADRFTVSYVWGGPRVSS